MQIKKLLIVMERNLNEFFWNRNSAELRHSKEVNINE
jgi:hypothetical protein